MKLHEVRKKYFDFFSQEGHAIIPSSPLTPENDPTTLFTGSGMQPLIPYLLGKDHPMGNRLVNSQKCFRAEDIEEIGDNRHTTFFEMLGNWSLGDYFKKEQLQYFFTFLVKEIGIDPRRLYVTVFSGDDTNDIRKDDESVALWKDFFSQYDIDAKVVHLETEENGGQLGMQGGRIFAYGVKKNWWSRSGIPQNMPIGEPGGPDSEVFFEFETVEHSSKFGKYCHPNCDCGRYMEIGNSVFMEFLRSKKGFDVLPQRNVDFGGGLERITAASENKNDVFCIDIFQSIIACIEEYSKKKYEEDKRAFRILSDHIRASVFIMNDGVFPSNTGQGYVLRRLLRRAIRFADSLNIPQGKLTSLVDAVILNYSEMYSSLQENSSKIKNLLEEEEKKFRNTLTKGIKEFEKRAQAGSISGKDAFVLFSTYGFPMEMTQELSLEKGISVDRSQYEKEFEEHRNLSRTASAGTFKGGLADSSEKTTMLHTTTHLMLAGLRKYLGDHVHQAGSNITQERIRFDFTHGEKVESEILKKVEKYVNEAIVNGCHVFIKEMSKDEAKAEGVEGSFWEKYPNRVSVYSVESDDGTIYSRELCGGPHVESTNAISGKFAIIKEQSSGAGIRRVKAVLK
ncbi:MAG: alanine--tRNA ligase [Candidatus Moraniibacteriota bacterium]|nr:MAG: alanine--tRNA ligase [Candidatus Moranbacteria bacterium]